MSIITNQYAGESLYHKYAIQSGPQPCYVWLDVEHATYGAEYNPDIGNTPERCAHGRCRHYTIPCLRPSAVRDLLEELEDALEDIYLQSRIYTDAFGNARASLNDGALAAEGRVKSILAKGFDHSDLWQVYDAAEWFAGVSAAKIGISVHTTDDDLTEIRRTLLTEIEASPDVDEVDGLSDCLREMRDNCTGAGVYDAAFESLCDESIKSQVEEGDEPSLIIGAVKRRVRYGALYSHNWENVLVIKRTDSQQWTVCYWDDDNDPAEAILAAGKRR
jgi:hypothetical protein